MSIASKTNPERAGHGRWSDTLLVEPENAETDVADIAGHKLGDEQQSPVKAFAEILLIIRGGIKEGEIDKTLATIDLYVELAFLESTDYAKSLEHFRAELEGHTLSDGSIEQRSATGKESTTDANNWETVDLDSSGGLLPIPVSITLLEALQADAERCQREPEAQVVAILSAYYLERGGRKANDKERKEQ